MTERMIRRSLPMALIVVATLAIHAQSQGPGSTVPGDYLRGVGIMAWGEGTYNYNTALANSINVDTVIRWTEYMADVAKLQTHDHVALIRREADKAKQAYSQKHERLLNSPEARDIENADALNETLGVLLNSRTSESALRGADYQVPLPAALIRQIPFKLDEKGEKFSMERLSVKGPNKWPPFLQDDRFQVVKKRYERVLDKALEQAIEGKMQIPTFDELKDVSDDLYAKLVEIRAPSPERGFMEAKERIDDLKKTVRLLETDQIERAIADIDKYGGTTVNDLKIFMQTHHLRFAPAKTPEERAIYPEIYAALTLQREKAPSQ